MITAKSNRRLYPKLWDCDYLHLSTLAEALRNIACGFQGTILDYGCGSKPYIDLFTSGTRYIGVDFNVQESCDLVLEADGTLPCGSIFSDAIVSFQVLEHVPSPDFFISECWRVLKPGGRLLITTHGMWPYHPGPDNDDFLRWTSAGLERLIHSHGFCDVTVQGVCGGYLCLIQQLLALHDPARIKRNFTMRFASKMFNGLINSIGALLLKIMPKMVQKGDILPICYLVVAQKPLNGCE